MDDTSRISAPETVRGLQNYELRPLSPAAREALDRLYAAGWMSGQNGRCGRCGKPRSLFSTLWCSRCRDTCRHQRIKGYVIKSDGCALPTGRCGVCSGMVLPPPVRGDWLYDVVFWDYRQLRPVPPCERCGDPNGVQYHHWAPRAIFDDAEDWPQAALCQRCHSIWHQAMRSAAGVGLPEGSRIAVPARYSEITLVLHPHLNGVTNEPV